MNRAERRAKPKKPTVKRRRASSPIEAVVLKQIIITDLNRLRTGAGLHAMMGGDAATIMNLAGRLIFITCHAIGKQYPIEQPPEARILMGAANALGDLSERPQDIEKHRGAIQSGLAAIDRLMPDLSEWALAEGALKLDEMLKSPAGLSVGDINSALKKGQK